jgi:large subunit ribosomal protein L20
MRATNNVASRRRRKKVLKQARGFRGGQSKLIRTAIEKVRRAEVFAYRDRKTKKREIRALWITRIGIASKNNGLSYSRFIHGLLKAGIALDRKILADLAVNAPASFAELVKKAQSALA